MTCLEAQSNIMSFIDKKLPGDTASDFVKHMRYCKNCREELEIYYTLLTGMRQLDSGEELSHDFKKDLEDDLNRIDHKIRQKHRFRVSAFGIIFAICCVALLLFYDQILNRVYDSEQRMKKEAQGDTYFYDYYSDYISLVGVDFIDAYKRVLPPVEVTDYERIQMYNLVHPFVTEPPEDGEEDHTKTDESGGEAL